MFTRLQVTFVNLETGHGKTLFGPFWRWCSSSEGDLVAFVLASPDHITRIHSTASWDVVYETRHFVTFCSEGRIIQYQEPTPQAPPSRNSIYVDGIAGSQGRSFAIRDVQKGVPLYVLPLDDWLKPWIVPAPGPPQVHAGYVRGHYYVLFSEGYKSLAIWDLRTGTLQARMTLFDLTLPNNV